MVSQKEHTFPIICLITHYVVEQFILRSIHLWNTFRIWRSHKTGVSHAFSSLPRGIDVVKHELTTGDDTSWRPWRRSASPGLWSSSPIYAWVGMRNFFGLVRKPTIVEFLLWVLFKQSLSWSTDMPPHSWMGLRVTTAQKRAGSCYWAFTGLERGGEVFRVLLLNVWYTGQQLERPVAC